MAHVHEACLYEWFALAPTLAAAQKCEHCGFRYGLTSASAVRLRRREDAEEAAAASESFAFPSPTVMRRRTRRYLCRTVCLDTASCLVVYTVLLAIAGAALNVINCLADGYIIPVPNSCTSIQSAGDFLTGLCTYGLICPSFMFIVFVCDADRRQLLLQICCNCAEMPCGTCIDMAVYSLLLFCAMFYKVNLIIPTLFYFYFAIVARMHYIWKYAPLVHEHARGRRTNTPLRA